LVLVDFVERNGNVHLAPHQPWRACMAITAPSGRW
jgi:hypothetical protein